MLCGKQKKHRWCGISQECASWIWLSIWISSNLILSPHEPIGSPYTHMLTSMQKTYLMRHSGLRKRDFLLGVSLKPSLHGGEENMKIYHSKHTDDHWSLSRTQWSCLGREFGSIIGVFSKFFQPYTRTSMQWEFLIFIFIALFLLGLDLCFQCLNWVILC